MIGLKQDIGTMMTPTTALFAPSTQQANYPGLSMQALCHIEPSDCLGDKDTIYVGDKAVATAPKQANGPYYVDCTLLTCELGQLRLIATAAAAMHTQSEPALHKSVGLLNGVGSSSSLDWNCLLLPRTRTLIQCATHVSVAKALGSPVRGLSRTG